MEYISDRITIDNDLCNGKPTIRGKRITVQTILEFLSAGDSPQDILKQYPSLEMADINACLKFAAGFMNNRFTIKSFVNA
ncbi:MAG: DUF433 domain-containing protein [Bacteroidales bacterium]|nr:DUF433 domain-containing protein [Bacteroidales bacterium]